MFNLDDIHNRCFSVEKQLIDRKSACISARDLACLLVVMANADGGYIAIGIEDDGEITGIDDYTLL